MAPLNNNFPQNQGGYNPMYGNPRSMNNGNQMDIYRQQQANLANLGNQNGQMPTQNGARNYIPGRMVANEQEIMAGEVPMDGSLSLFLQNDLRCIYAKQWNSNGTIDTVRYVLDIPAPQEQPNAAITNEVAAAIMERLDKIEKALKQKKYPNNKKGKVDNNA